MIIYLKTAEMLSITLTRRALFGCAGIVQLANYPEVVSWHV
jgi:hypothetical protein